MVIEVSPIKEDYDKVALKVFMKSLEVLGGPKKLIEYRNLTWLPSLMIASYAIVLRELAHWSTDLIASYLGSTKQTIKKILEADPDLVMKKIHKEIEAKEVKEHTAGGIAKIAWNEIKSGREEISFMIDISKQAIESIGGPTWAIETLVKIKGLDFPIEDSKVLEERLKGIKVLGKDLRELVKELEYPIKNPAELLKKLSRKIKGE